MHPINKPFSLALPAFLFSPLVLGAAPAPAQSRVLPPARVAKLDATFTTGAPVFQAAFLANQALSIAAKSPAARVVAVRSAAALLPRLSPDSFNNTPGRDALTMRWLGLAMSPSVPRAVRLDGISALFDVATKTDLAWAQKWAPRVPDAAARTGAYLDISRALEAKNAMESWRDADNYAAMAQAAARKENAAVPRARALTFVAYRMLELSPERLQGALQEASVAVHQVPASRTRDNLLAELAGAAGRYDLAYGRRIASEISDEGLKNLAGARVNLTEVSQTTLTTRSKERITALAAAAAPFDSRALPVLLTLPPQPEVLKAISDTLPQISANSRPAIEISQLETLWNYSKTAPAGAYRDQLQSRVARLMVLKDLWRGRSWGKELAWKGGRVQVGAFLNQVLLARRFDLGVAPLQDTAQNDASTAYEQALALPAPARVESLLLLAGQILG